MPSTHTVKLPTGELELSRAQLVGLAEEVGAHRVRSLDGLGLLHLAVDPAIAERELAAAQLDPEHGELWGSEAYWVRRALEVFRLDRPGDRVVLAYRHRGPLLTSWLIGSRGPRVVEISTCFDQPVEQGPLHTSDARVFTVRDLDEGTFDEAWPQRLGLDPGADDASPPPVSEEAVVAIREALDRGDEPPMLDLVDAPALVQAIVERDAELQRVVGWRAPDDDPVVDRQWIVADGHRWRLTPPLSRQ